METIQIVKEFQENLNTKFSSLQTQVDAIDLKLQKTHVADNPASDLSNLIWKHPEFEHLRQVGRGKCILQFPDLAFERKTTISEAALGSGTSGILMPSRVGGIVTPGRRQTFVADLLTRYPVTGNAIDFVRVSSDVTLPNSPQTETFTKKENAMSFATTNRGVKTLATWIPCSKQSLDDLAILRSVVDGSLRYALDLEVENQILLGDGTGQNLSGLAVEAATFNTALLTPAAGYNYVDCIGCAVLQIQLANELAPNFLALDPASYWAIRLLKDSYGRYLFESPVNTGEDFNLFGLRCVQTNSLSTHTFLLGNSSATAACIYERMGATIEISTEHSDYFTKNMIAIRAEERIALAIFRPNSFVYGSFIKSPA
jgi:HK97 family phage major capsid protein